MKGWVLGLVLALAPLAYADEATYESVRYGKQFATGLVKHDRPRVTAEHPLEDVKLPKSFHLKEFHEKGVGLPLTGIYDQGNCGSCVYNSVMKNLGDSMRLRGVDAPVQSRQWGMDCAAREWMCGGSYFEKVAGGVAAKGGAPAESKYPYRGRNQSCQDGHAELTSELMNYQIVDSSAKSVATWLTKGYPVSVTVAADGTWSGYRTGLYNGCSSMGTNHQVLIYGYDCESSVDADGNCVFNDRGYPKNGDGYAVVVNSWGANWGESGEMRSRWLARNGAKCNNLAEEAGILETGIPMPDPAPPVPPSPVPSTVPTWLAVGLGALCLVLLVVLALVARRK